MTHEHPQSENTIYQAEDGRTRIDVRLQDETVWLTQRQLSELIQISVPTMNQHLQNGYYEREVDSEATNRVFLIVQTEGRRKVTRTVSHYNLDTIISVGYRVRSHRGTQFRRWAAERLRKYLVKGFTLDDERLKAGRNPGLLVPTLCVGMHIPDNPYSFPRRTVGTRANAGSVSKEVAKTLALEQYETFSPKRLTQETEQPDEFDRIVMRIEGGK